MIDFFLVGAPKAGTTSIYNLLKQHPDIFLPSVKEPNFFTNVGPQKRNGVNIKDFSKYQSLYKAATTDQQKGDCSVSYMHDVDAAEKIYALNPNAKIIMVLRDPVKRAFSHWQMDKREGFTNKNFLQAFEDDFNYSGKRGYCYNAMYYDCSCYASSIERFQKYFSRVLIIVFEEAFLNIEKSQKEICDFLRISPLTTYSQSKHNESGEVKNSFFKFFYHNSAIRYVSRNIFSESAKQQLRKLMIKANDEKICESDYNLLKKYFKEDVCKTRKLLNKMIWTEFSE